MIKTIKQHVAKAKAVKFVNDNMVEQDLSEIKYQGRKYRESTVLSRFNEQLVEKGLKDYTVVLVSHETIDQKYQLDIETFLMYAEPVADDVTDEDEEIQEIYK